MKQAWWWLAGLILLALLVGVGWFARDRLFNRQSPANLEPILAERRNVGDIPLADYLPPPAEVAQLDEFSRRSLEILQAWFTDASKVPWPSTLALKGDEQLPGGDRRLRVRFERVQNFRVLEVADHPPIIELAAAKGDGALQLILGRGPQTDVKRFDQVADVRQAFSSLANLSDVRQVQGGGKFLDWVNLEAGVAGLQTEEKPTMPGRLELTVTFHSPTFQITLRQANGKWQIRKIEPAS